MLPFVSLHITTDLADPSLDYSVQEGVRWERRSMIDLGHDPESHFQLDIQSREGSPHGHRYPVLVAE